MCGQHKEMYYVSDIADFDKKRKKVLINNKAFFTLYNSEIKKYNIEPGTNISKELYEYITDELLYNRAKERALYIIKDGNKSQADIEKKLIVGGYPFSTINKVISFMKSYNFVDDKRYAQDFVSRNIKSKSMKYIRNKLYEKGISSEIIDEVVENYSENYQKCQRDLIEKHIRKKLASCDHELDFKEKNKILMYLTRKGFEYDTSKEVLRQVIGY